MAFAAVVKRVTADAHVCAEAAVRAFDPFASTPRFACYLATLHAFYAAIEPALAERLDGIVADGSVRFSKRRAIEADLDALGFVLPPPLSSPWVPRVGTIAEALGVAYVLEGKTLGSRFLLAEARDKLALDGARGARFLAGYGPRTGAMWNAYRATLDGWVRAHGRRRAILAGAHATFATFIACVSSPAAMLHRAASGSAERRPSEDTASP